MKNLVFFLEGKSDKAMLKGLLPQFLPKDVSYRFIVFEGKQDMENKLKNRLSGWKQANTSFVILMDQDQEDCKEIKTRIQNQCPDSTQHIIRIACHELESWYLGDLNAVAKAFNKPKILDRYKNKQKYQKPDNIQQPTKELIRITNKNYQKISGSRAIGLHLSIKNNKSHSFKVFIKGIKQLIQ